MLVVYLILKKKPFGFKKALDFYIIFKSYAYVGSMKMRVDKMYILLCFYYYLNLTPSFIYNKH